MAGLKYVFLVTIDSTDNQGAVIQTIRGSGSLLDLVEGRDPEPSDPTIFNRYVLKPSLVGGAEIPCLGWVGINKDVPAVVRNEYSQNATLWRTVEFGLQNFTRPYMQNYLATLAATQSATHGWHIIPGDNLTSGDLLSKFVPLI